LQLRQSDIEIRPAADLDAWLASTFREAASGVGASQNASGPYSGA
jgi:hypothetical protein